MEVGAIVLRGNRMVLARSLNKEYQGLRIPSLTLGKEETPEACAIRAITRYIQSEDCLGGYHDFQVAHQITLLSYN